MAKDGRSRTNRVTRRRFLQTVTAAGAGAAGGYDFASLHRALTETQTGWTLDLCGETLATGEAKGILLGGCLTMVEASLGTAWELDTRGAILLLEDCKMKPYQVDRSLLHLRQAGKLDGVRGIIFGDFPECDPPKGSRVTVRDVLLRHVRGWGVPVVWDTPVGHTRRAMLTLPLGVRARLRAGRARAARNASTTWLDILEPACAKA